MDNQTIGYRYSSSDRLKIVQFRKNGFTYSQLEPYKDWKCLKEEAKRLWGFYKSVRSSLGVIRVATRYINVIKVPCSISDFKEYLTAPPEVPEALPQGISSFLTRISIVNPEIKANAIITQALERVDPGNTPITLDIDVFISQSGDVKDETIWDQLDRLRSFKNQIFFESITQKNSGSF